MPRLSIFKSGRSTPSSSTSPDRSSPSASSPMRRPPVAYRASPTKKTASTPSPSPLAVRSIDFALPVFGGRDSPLRPPRPPQPLFTDRPLPPPPPALCAAEAEARAGSKTISHSHSHSRTTSCDTTYASQPSTPLAHARSSSFPIDILLDRSRPNIADPTAIPAPPRSSSIRASPQLSRAGLPSSVSRSASHITSPPKRRPAALKLRTSNLEPLLQSPTTPTPMKETHLGGVQLVRTTSSPALMQSGFEPAEELKSDGLVVAKSIPVKLEHRKSQSVGNLRMLRRPSTPPGVMPQQEPADGATSTPGPRTGSSSSGRTFANVPLPWHLQAATSIAPGQSGFLSATIASLPPPQMLPATLYQTCQTESRRLQEELHRLTRKYDRLLSQRDYLLQQLQLSLLHTSPDVLSATVANLRKANLKCDRAVRQMYVCNDQIRQIEVQVEQHRLGCLQLATASGGVGTEKLFAQSKMEEEVGWDARECEVSGSEGEEAVHGARKSILEVQVEGLNFPLPPSRSFGSIREMPITQAKVDVNLAQYSEREDEIGNEAEDDSLTHLTHDPCSPNAILIFPPDETFPLFVHTGTNKADGEVHDIDLPHTPYLDHMCGKPHQQQVHARPEFGTLPRHNAGRRGKGTAPLNISHKPPVAGLHGRRMRARSMTVAGAPQLESTLRARRGRESQLETPESILLSLATAQLWTQPIASS